MAKKVNQQRRIEVCAHWAGMKNPMLMGVLYAAPSRGKEIFSFEYDESWVEKGHAQFLDPQLGFFKGPQYAPEGKDNFGLFLDSSPDRWGRVLMRRREAQLAREEKRPAVTLKESDYLLGVHDGNRMGGLRFREKSSGPFLHDNAEMAAPPWTSLRELEHASLQLEKDNAEEQKDYKKWLKLLIAPGGSLGGARPKASVLGEDGTLWIAKFPSRNDDLDIGSWEYLVYKLAKTVKIQISPSERRHFSGHHHTFLTQRFDRNKKNERLHFASAMTLLNKSDGAGAAEGVSYLELAEFITAQGAQPDRDLEELWRRIVFYICTSNTDDHLRNHGFMWTQKGWVLSPAFDINPSETGDGLKLNISLDDNAQDLDLAREVAPYFRIKPKAAEAHIKEIVKVVKGWKSLAKELGIPASQQSRMANAFRVP